ncbi:hypothetical protein Hanom_Chr07g00674781 [Helianthus anomalus]
MILIIIFLNRVNYVFGPSGYITFTIFPKIRIFNIYVLMVSIHGRILEDFRGGARPLEFFDT